MKRYDVGEYGEMYLHSDGKWTEAELAINIYDAAVDLLNNIAKTHGLHTWSEFHCPYVIKLADAVKAARGEGE